MDVAAAVAVLTTLGIVGVIAVAATIGLAVTLWNKFKKG